MTRPLDTKRTLENLSIIANQFESRGKITDIQEYGSGNVNDTYLVTVDSDAKYQFILQRINTHVFRRPELVMLNMRTITEHISQRLDRSDQSQGRSWEVPRVLQTRDTKDHWIDGDGSFWRAISFIGKSRSYDTVRDLDHAREVAYALGMFQNLINDLPIGKLADTLMGFHITPGYLKHYDAVLDRYPQRRSSEIDYARSFIGQRRDWAHVLEDAKAKGKLCLRPIHGDPKVNNVMINTASGQAISMVDLDTVKPGLIHYDIGDCLRSCCNPLGEETPQWEQIRFEPDLCRAMLQGYLSLAAEFLTANDYDYLYDAIRLLPFELGLRFFTDYLEGNIYFKAKHDEHNLVRALVQFRLTESIESQAAEIRQIVQDMR